MRAVVIAVAWLAFMPGLIAIAFLVVLAGVAAVPAARIVRRVWHRVVVRRAMCNFDRNVREFLARGEGECPAPYNDQDSP